MSSPTPPEFEETPSHLLLPARITLPGDNDTGSDSGSGGGGTLEDSTGGVDTGDSINGWTLRAVFDLKTPVEVESQPQPFISIRFASGFDSTSESIDIRYFHSFVSNITWHTNRIGTTNALQERAGEPFAQPWVGEPEEGATYIEESVGPKHPALNELVIKVVGTQATFEVNGVVVGFLAYEFWPIMTNVKVSPDETGLFWDGTTMLYRRMESLEVKRYVPPLAWGIFGAAGGVALVALLAMAVAK